MAQITTWIRERKRFAYRAPDYIVVGMEYLEYERLFAKKQRDFNYEMFEDELARLSDEDFEKLNERFRERLAPSPKIK